MPPKPRVFRDPPAPGAPRPGRRLRAWVVTLLVVVAAALLGGAVYAALAPAPADDGVAVEYADGTLAIRYAPAVPANRTVVRVTEPADSLIAPDRPVIERTYGACAFDDTIDLGARTGPVFTVTLEEVDPGERRYRYWTIRDLDPVRMLGLR